MELNNCVAYRISEVIMHSNYLKQTGLKYQCRISNIMNLYAMYLFLIEFVKFSSEEKEYIQSTILDNMHYTGQTFLANLLTEKLGIRKISVEQSVIKIYGKDSSSAKDLFYRVLKETKGSFLYNINVSKALGSYYDDITIKIKFYFKD